MAPHFISKDTTTGSTNPTVEYPRQVVESFTSPMSIPLPLISDRHTGMFVFRVAQDCATRIFNQFEAHCYSVGMEPHEASSEPFFPFVTRPCSSEAKYIDLVKSISWNQGAIAYAGIVAKGTILTAEALCQAQTQLHKGMVVGGLAWGFLVANNRAMMYRHEVNYRSSTLALIKEDEIPLCQLHYRLAELDITEWLLCTQKCSRAVASQVAFQYITRICGAPLTLRMCQFDWIANDYSIRVDLVTTVALVGDFLHAYPTCEDSCAISKSSAAIQNLALDQYNSSFDCNMQGYIRTLCVEIRQLCESGNVNNMSGLLAELFEELVL